VNLSLLFLKRKSLLNDVDDESPKMKESSDNSPREWMYKGFPKTLRVNKIFPL